MKKSKLKEENLRLKLEIAKLTDDVYQLCDDYSSEQSLTIRMNRVLGAEVERVYYAGFKGKLKEGSHTFQGIRSMFKDMAE